MIYLLILLPMLLALAAFALPSDRWRPWLLPAGPLRNSKLPPLGITPLIQLPQLSPSSLNDAPMNLV